MLSPPRLVGDDRTVAVRFVALAVCLQPLYAAPFLLDSLGSIAPELYWPALLVLTAGTAALNAYHNSGVIVSWLLAGAGIAPIAVGYAFTAAPIGVEPTAVEAVGQTVLFVGGFGVPVGTAGFALGAGLRRLRNGSTAASEQAA